MSFNLFKRKKKIEKKQEDKDLVISLIKGSIIVIIIIFTFAIPMMIIQLTY